MTVASKNHSTEGFFELAEFSGSKPINMKETFVDDDVVGNGNYDEVVEVGGKVRMLCHVTSIRSYHANFPQLPQISS